MSSTLDTVREALQAALLPKLTAIEKDLQAFRAEVAQSNHELRAEMKQSNQELRAEMKQNNQELRAEGIENYQGLRAEMQQINQELRAEVKQDIQGLRSEVKQDIQELRADLELKFSMLVNEIQKIGIRTELTAEKFKAETETYVHRNITPLAERVAVLEMSLRDLKEKLEKAS
jgi:hypothetical protein